MLQRRLTQQELGAEVGAAQNYLSQIVNGTRKPSRELAQKISKATAKEISIEQLLSFTLPKGIERPAKRRRRASRETTGHAQAEK